MPFSPSDIFDVAVLEAEDIAGNDGDEITVWTKQSGTLGTSPFQDVATKYPLLKKGANGLNGKNVLLFDGDNDYFTCGDDATLDFGIGAFAIGLVLKITGSTGYIFLKDNAAGDGNGIYFYAASSSWRYWNGSADIIIGAMDTNYHLILFTRSGTGANGFIPYFDGTAQTAGTESRTLSNAISATIGLSADGVAPFLGSVAAIYIASSVPSDANRNLFGGYINGKYGLTIAGATTDSGVVNTSIEVQTAVTDVP